VKGEYQMGVKKILTMVVIIAMMVSSLVSCGPNSDQTNQPTTAPTEKPTEKPTAAPTAEPEPEVEEQGEPVVISMYVTANETEFDKEQQQRFMDKYTNIIIDKKIVAETDGSDALVMFAAGTNPDIGGVSMPQFANYIYAGLPRPIDDYVNNWSELDQIKQEVLANYTVNGKIFDL